MTVTVRASASGPGPTHVDGSLSGRPRVTSPLSAPAFITPLVLVVLLMGAVLKFCAPRLDNTDTWFHLTLGDHFRDGWSLSEPGALTPFATSDWVATQWSTEVAASYAQSWFGLPGVAWLFGALYLVLVMTTYVVCRQRCSALPATIVTIMVIVGSATALSARPQIISLVLLAVTVDAWLRTWEDGRIRWWLIALTWVWATAHGLWSAGVLVGFVACAGLVLDRRVRGRRAGLVFAVPLLSLLATALTPVGPRLLMAQFAVSDRTSLIPEWGPTSFRSVSALVVAAMLAWVAVLWARRGGTAWTPLLLLLLAAGWMLLVTRMVPLGGCDAGPAAGECRRAGDAGPSRVPDRETRRAGSARARVRRLPRRAGPRRPADRECRVRRAHRLPGRLAALPEGTPVIVDDGIGAWMEWAFPEVQPVIDGMLDAYPVDYIAKFSDLRRGPAGMAGLRPRLPRQGRRRAGRFALIADALQDQLGWRLVQRDRDWVYLEAGPPQP